MSSGKLFLVSVGPGDAALIPPLAREALQASDAIVGYELYLRHIEPWIAGKEIHTPPLTRERERASLALELARGGKVVSLISSGDIGVYAMAALAFEELRGDDSIEVQVIPGITAANACASLLGSPLSHDFATLSLSDLLCPWEWIETRARHIALSDLACVFYNVQSQGRREGVYKVLRLMLEHKRPGTVCGVVRNAYRPEQTVEITTLQELLSREFDMLTTLVIGNRFTQRRGQWMFTPRGYNDWRGEEEAKDVPQGAVWVFSGTGDGNKLAVQLAGQGQRIVVSVASEYGKERAQESVPGAHVVSGRLGAEARRRLLRESGARAVVDATHPYATGISAQLHDLAQELNLPYLRFERPSTLPEDAEGVIRCTDMSQAASLAVTQGKRIFLATGSKDLETFLSAPGAEERQWFARVTPQSDVIEAALRAGVPRPNLCAMQGPFTREFNEALWRGWNIDLVVTKDSGEAGGFPEKHEAALALGIPLVVVERPQSSFPHRHSTFDSLLSVLHAQLAPLENA